MHQEKVHHRGNKMTRIHITESEEQIELICEGHAGYSSPGTDIVCAGISALICAWQMKCLSLDEEKKIEVEHWEVEFGKVNIAIKTKDYEIHEAFSVVKMGLMIIQEQYPDYVQWCGEK